MAFVESQIFADKMRRVHFTPSSSFSSSFIFSLSFHLAGGKQEEEEGTHHVFPPPVSALEFIRIVLPAFLPQEKEVIKIKCGRFWRVSLPGYTREVGVGCFSFLT